MKPLLFMARLLLLGLILEGHTEDGNVWGIYFSDFGLKIGDFWAALIVIYLVFKMYSQIDDLYKEYLNG